jgi:hypothetical protein
MITEQRSALSTLDDPQPPSSRILAPSSFALLPLANRLISRGLCIPSFSLRHARIATRSVAGWAFASLADVAKGGDGAKSALREILASLVAAMPLCESGTNLALLDLSSPKPATANLCTTLQPMPSR